MADIVLTPTSPLSGQSTEIAGCTLAERADIALTSMACPLGGDKAFEKHLTARFGVARPDPRISSVKGQARAVSMSPDQVLVLHEASQTAEPNAAAYQTDQTGNWCVIELTGPRATEALRRVCPLDLADSVFAVDGSARTVMEHMGAVVIKTAPQSFLLLSASSSALSFWHAIEQSLKNIDGDV